VPYIADQKTIADRVHILEEHNHSPQLVAPAGASSITLTCTASAWTHGGKTQIIAAGAISDHFDIHWVLIDGISANGQYEIILYSGLAAAEVEIARLATARNSNFTAEGALPTQMRVQEPGTRISGSVASSTGNADTLGVKLFYHEY